MRAPLPVRLRPFGHSEFVDRSNERAALTRALSAVDTGERRAAFVIGEAGIGKTRLVSELAVSAHESGTLVLAGRCDEALGLSYQPFAEALEHLVVHAPDGLLDEHIRSYGDTVARIVPALARHARTIPRPAQTTGSDIDQYVMFAAIEELLASAAEESPVLLVLEDMHWADTPTILLLRRLVTSPRSDPLFVLSTSRLTDLSDDHPLRSLLTDLHREPSIERVDLTGLADDDVAQLVGAMLEEPLDAGGRRFAATLHESTSGNPFFVTELVRNFAEAHPAPLKSVEWDLETTIERSGGLPSSINETLLRRVERLGPGGQQCLSAAAVIGDEFDLELLLAVAETESIPEHVDDAVRAGLLLETTPEGPHFRFVHALVRRCLYGELGPSRRAELHRNVALALERRVAAGAVSAAELARHWLVAAGTAESEKPLRYSVLAGDEALAKLAPDEARRWFGVALERLADQREPSDSERCELLIKRGEAERQAGEPAFRETLLEAAALAERAGRDDALIRAALANTRGLQSATGMVDQERVDTLLKALQIVGDADSPERARLLALLGAELTFHDRSRSVEVSGGAVAVARQVADPATLSFVMRLRFVTIWSPDTHSERMANTAEAFEASERLDDPLTTFHACYWRGQVLIEDGDARAARGWVARARELADRLRQPTTQWLATGAEANLAIIDGRLAEAEQLVATAFEVGQPSEPDAFACYSAQLTSLRFEKGELEPLIPILEQVVEQNPGIPGFRSTLALALIEAERIDRALEVLEIDASSGFRDLAYDATWLAVACIYARVATRVGDREAAAALRGLLEPWCGLIAYPGWGVWGSVDHFVGELAVALGDVDAAERLLTAARACNEYNEAPVWAARTRVATARLLMARGEEASAHDELAQALESALALGAGGVAKEAQALLGGEVRR